MSVILGSAVEASQMNHPDKAADIIEAFCTEGRRYTGPGTWLSEGTRAAWSGRGGLERGQGRRDRGHDAGSPSGSLKGCDKTISPLLTMRLLDFLILSSNKLAQAAFDPHSILCGRNITQIRGSLPLSWSLNPHPALRKTILFPPEPKNFRFSQCLQSKTCQVRGHV